ncbi:MAG: phosphatidylglycerophosphatase A [Candidatus Thiodiazotropha sp.]
MTTEHAPNKPDMGNPVHLLAFGFGSGLAPKAPGTFGTLVGIPFYLLLQPLPPVYYGILVALTFLLGIGICGRTSRDLGVHDHGGIVWDEIVGYLVTMLWAPQGWVWMVIGFVLFRFFDILKPWPIRWFDRKVSGGFGIMLDDLIAGLFAAALLFAIQHMGWF